MTEQIEEEVNLHADQTCGNILRFIIIGKKITKICKCLKNVAQNVILFACQEQFMKVQAMCLCVMFLMKLCLWKNDENRNKNDDFAF